jgi:ComF family protein
MFKLLKKIGLKLLDLFLPIECVNCKTEGVYLCDACFEKLKINNPEDSKILSANLKTPNLDAVWIAGNYEDSLLKKIIIKYKYNFLEPLHKPLSLFLKNFWEKHLLSLSSQKINQDNFLVIPIPLSKKRLKWRGFNQAELLAINFCSYFNYPLSLNLEKIKNRPPQVNLNEKEREKNLQSVFAFKGKRLEEKNILLIDDVATTGATLNEAAIILKKAGAKKVEALVLAKG